MNTNSEVKQAFNNGKFAEACNLRTDGKTLVSYRTIVAQKQENGKTLKTCHYYSNTTAHHLSGINYDYEVPFVEKPTTDEHKKNYKYICSISEAYARKATTARTAHTKEHYTMMAKRFSFLASSYKTAFEI